MTHRLRLPVTLFLLAAFLSGCAWLGPRELTTLEPEGGYGPVFDDNRPAVEQVTSLRVERTPGGIILHATGVPPTQEYWNADLVELPRDQSPAATLEFSFRARPPIDETPGVGAPISRTLHGAVFVTNVDLEGIRRLTVIGAENSRSISR